MVVAVVVEVRRLALQHAGLLVVPHERAARVALAGVSFALRVAGADEVLINVEPVDFQTTIVPIALVCASNAHLGLEQGVVGLREVLLLCDN